MQEELQIQQAAFHPVSYTHLSDVIVKDIRNGRVAIFEAKYSKTLDALPDACDAAIQQINDRMYAADFRDDYDDILCYGIAFFKKRCMVRKK